MKKKEKTNKEKDLECHLKMKKSNLTKFEISPAQESGCFRDLHVIMVWMSLSRVGKNVNNRRRSYGLAFGGLEISRSFPGPQVSLSSSSSPFW